MIRRHPDDDDPHGDWEVEHPESCAKETITGDTTFDGTPIPPYEHYLCGVEWEIENLGSEAFADPDGSWPDVGRHMIRHFYSPGISTWMGPAEPESYIEFVTEVEA